MPLGKRDAANGAGGELSLAKLRLARTREVPMKTASVLGAALALLAAPALAQYGDGGAERGWAARQLRPQGWDNGYGGPYGGYAYGPYYGGYGPPAYSWGGPVYYGYPRYRGGPGILVARPYYPRRIYRPYARVYRGW